MFVKVIAEVPQLYSVNQLRADNPNVSFPRVTSHAALAAFGVFPAEWAAQPAHTPAAEKLEPGAFTEVDGAWFRGWNVITLSQEELAANVQTKLAELAAARSVKEEGGVIWTKGADTFFLDTSAESQRRLTSAKLAADNGDRRPQLGNDPVWKMAQLDAQGNPSLIFRPSTSADVAEWSDLVIDHVQKCFEVEGVAYQKVLDAAAISDYPAMLGVSYTDEFINYGA
jgi:hypothetical protein